MCTYICSRFLMIETKAKQTHFNSEIKLQLGLKDVSVQQQSQVPVDNVITTN